MPLPPEEPEVTPLTPEEQAQAFADAVHRAGIRVDFGDLSEDARKSYWAQQSLKLMGADWDGKDADVLKFAESLGLAPGLTVEKTYAVCGDTFVDLKDPEDSSPAWHKLNAARGESDPDGLMRAFGAADHPLGACALRIEFKCTAFYWEEDQDLSTSEFVTFYTTDAAGTVRKSGTQSGSVSWGTADGDPIPDSWWGELDYWIEISGQVITVHYRTTLHVQRSSGRPDTVHLPSDYTKFTRTLNGLTEPTPATVIFTMPTGGGGGGGEIPADWYTLYFTAQAGSAGTYGDPGAGSFPVPSARTEVPSLGSGGYGGHGGGGGAGGATTIIRRFETDKADALTQLARSRPHGYGSPGGQGGQGGNGGILIFW